jgi:hypothetical protein
VLQNTKEIPVSKKHQLSTNLANSTFTDQSEEQSPESRMKQLKNELEAVRRSSLEATRRGDVFGVARLTSDAFRLNQAIEAAYVETLEVPTKKKNKK